MKNNAPFEVKLLCTDGSYSSLMLMLTELQTMALREAMNGFFSSSKGITYGGSQVGNEVRVAQFTLKPGTKITENPDGTVTISRVDNKEGSKSVVKLDTNGKVVESKTTKVEFTADGGAFQRITDQDGNVREVTLVHGGAGQERPKVFFDDATGHLTVVSVTSKDENTKTVATFNEDGGVINRVDYDYDILEDGRVVEYSVDMNGQHYFREIIGLEQVGQISKLQTSKTGYVFATSTLPDGNYILVSMTQSSAQGFAATVTHETGSDGSVIQKYVSSEGTVIETVLIEGKPGSDKPIMEVDAIGNVTFSVTRADGTKVHVALDNSGLEFSGGTRTYETGPNGTCVLKYYDNQTETVTTKTLLEATEGAGIPVITRDRITGEFIIRAFQADGSSINVRMDANGWKVLDKYRLSLQVEDGEYYEVYESLTYTDPELSPFGRMRIRGGWIEEIGTNPSKDDSNHQKAIHGQGGLRDIWDRVLDWGLRGVPLSVDNVQTIGDSNWKGWKENGGTVERESVDFIATGVYKGVEKTVRLKAGGAGDDAILGADGNDLFYGGAGDDSLSGGEDGDLLSGEDGNDVVDGGDGNDQLHGGHGDDVIHGGAGDDLLDDALEGTTDGINVTGNDTMDGGAGNDLINGRAGDDVLVGGTGKDTLNGGDGADRLDGGDEADFLSAGADNDTLLGGADSDALYGNDGNDYADGGVGNDLLFGGRGHDLLEGGEGNDVMDGGADNDTVRGGAGDDVLFGDTGSDSLEGGAGDDMLHGGSFGDAFGDTLDGGDGKDTVDYSNSSAGVSLNLSRGTGAGGAAQGDVLRNIENVLGTAHNDTLVVGNADIANFDIDDYLARNGDIAAHMAANGLDRSWAYTHWLAYGRFEGRAGGWVGGSQSGADTGTSFDMAGYLLANADVAKVKKDNNYDDAWVYEHWIAYGRHEGRAGALKASGSVINAGAGHDTVQGGVYSDYLVGGDGNDVVQGQAGQDVVVGGQGNDQLWGGDGNDQVFGGAGEDLVIGDAGNDLLHGGDANDTLYGGAGEDTMHGGSSGDGLDGGDGNDVLWGEDGHDALSGGNGHDKLYGGNHDDKAWGGAGNDTADGGEGHDQLWGEDGNDSVSGGNGNDFLSGGAGQDTISGGANEDQLYGDDGNDLLQGDDGHDLLWGGTGNDWMNGGAHNDTLYGGSNEDTVFGGDGNDVLHGQDGYDVLNGGAGDDVLYGGAHADVFVFDVGGGSDVVRDFGSGDVLRLTSVSKSEWWTGYNSPKTITNWGTLVGTEITIGDRKILLEGIKAEQLKGGAVSGGAWEWHL